MNTRGYVRQQRITLAVKGNGVRTDGEGWEHNSYTVTLKSPTTSEWRGIPFKMGMGHENGPDAATVLDALALDASFGDQSFSDFCSELGYDEDSRKAERMHRECVKTARKMRDFLGDAEFQRLVYSGEIERL